MNGLVGDPGGRENFDLGADASHLSPRTIQMMAIKEA